MLKLILVMDQRDMNTHDITEGVALIIINIGYRSYTITIVCFLRSLQCVITLV